MLTKEQFTRRRRGIGASEVPALLGLEMPGHKTMVDVWARKSRGPNGEQPPLVVENRPEPDKCASFRPIVKGDPSTAGNILEEGIAQLYQFMTGNQILRAPTCVHPDHPWALATPDRGIYNGVAVELDKHGTGFVNRDAFSMGSSHGLEIKLVGSNVARYYWHGDGAPDYVRVQCQWGMHVTGLDRWDIMALINGSEPRLIRIERDDDVIDGLHEIAEQFWHDYVLADVMPPASDGAAAMRVMQAKWREDDGKVVPAPAEAADVAHELFRLQQEAKSIDAQIDVAKATLCALVGEHKGIRDDRWGKFHWGSRKGSPAWKAIALELADGVIDDALIEKHRGEAKRVARMYASKILKGEG